MQRRPIAVDQCLLLPTCPTLDLTFNLKCLKPRLKILGPDQFYRSSPLGVSHDFPMLMLCDTLLEIIGMANIETAISAAQHVSIKTHSNPLIPNLRSP